MANSSSTVSFKYDPFGRRIYKSSTSGTSVYAYDGLNLIEETNSSGAVVARYTEPSDVDQPLAMLRSGTTSYYEQDGLGSVTSLSNGAGSLAQTYTFDSFGKTTNLTGSLTNPFQYTARELDPETNLYYYRARYYDPSAGRFLSEDPLAFNVGLNFYDYVNGDPTNLSDPKGLFGWGDVLPAWNHYCDGTGTPWSAPFASIKWDTSNIDAKIKGLVGGSCSERTIPVSMNVGISAEGADFFIIGHHAVRVQGTIHVSCDCTWSFQGDMSSALGYDIYEFPPTHGIFASTENWTGRNRCPGKGKPFNIYLPGSISSSKGGKINGTPTCPCSGGGGGW